MFAVVDNWIGIATCLEELAHFLCFFRVISVVATKTPQSKELRVWDGLLDVLGGMTSVISSCVGLYVLVHASGEPVATDRNVNV